jgi:hypothetical protein
MFNEYDHLITLAKKYDLGQFTIGLFYGSCKMQFCMITFEKFIKMWSQANTHREREFVVSNWIEVADLKFIENFKDGIE